MKYRWII